MADEEPDDQPERKPFALLLQEMRKNGLHSELGDELAELVRKVTDTGKAGTLTLTLSLKPTVRAERTTIDISDKIVVKAPRPAAPSTMFWPDEKGNLLRNPPNQPELPLRELKGGKTDVKAPLREVGDT